MNGQSEIPDTEAKMIVCHPSQCQYESHNHGSNHKSEVHGSFSEPIKVEEVHKDRYVKWEYHYILKKFLYHKCLQQFMSDEKFVKRVDRIVVRDYGGKHHVFYFDVTEATQLEDKRFEQVMKDYEAGKPIAPNDKRAIEAAIDLRSKYLKSKMGRG